MFRAASAFNQDISGWATGAVTNMTSMFRRASAFNQNIGGWDTGAVTDMHYMFDDVTLSTSNYDSLLDGWNSQTLQTGVIFDGGNSTYCAAVAHDNLTSATGHGWTITDGGIDANCPPQFSSSDSVNVAENTTAVITVVATDPNPGDTVAYSLTGGADQGKFTINSSTGELTFTTAPDYENPTDADTNNEYIVEVTASDGTNTNTQTITITVTYVNESSHSSRRSSHISKEKVKEIFGQANNKKEEVKEETKEQKCSYTYSKMVRRGSRGEYVRQLQTILNGLGFNTGIADGLYGPKTMAGIKAFQRAMGIMDDGIFGPQSNGKLTVKCSA
jgi:surface protein